MVLFATLAVLFSSLSVAAAEKRRFDIAAGEASSTLNEFSRQAELQIYFDADAVRRFMTNAVAGEFDAADALSTMLGGTGLAFEFVNERTVAIMLATRDVRAIRMSGMFALNSETDASAPGQEGGPVENARPDESASQESPALDHRWMPEVLVKNSRILNIDIRRSRDDPQPYVIFEREVIEKSGSRDIEEFLRNQLPATSSAALNTQSDSLGSLSAINLRGLGTNQTLLLVDGRRIAPRSSSGSPGQPDLNGIPLAAVERIEVLPTTASGIFGGSATGGVVNVVLRRDYSGVETKLSYDDTFDGGGARRRVDLAAGLNFEGGRTNVLLAGSYSEGDTLFAGERDFLERNRALLLENNPGRFFGAAFPPLGATTNIRSVTGANLTLKPAFGGQSLGSPRTYVPIGYAGPASDQGAALIANGGQYNLDGAETAQFQAGDRRGLLNTPTVESLMMTVRRDFTPWLQAFVDASASKNSGAFTSSRISGQFTLPATAPNNPFNEQIRVTTPAFGTDQSATTPYYDYRAVAGLIFELPRSWQAGLDYTWTRSRFSQQAISTSLTAAATAAVNSGALNLFRDTNAFPASFAEFVVPSRITPPTNATLKDVMARIAGPLGWSLPAGPPTLTFSLEHRDESVDAFENISAASTFRAYGASQSIVSAYLETRVPLVSAQNHFPGVDLLELQLAVRRDDYNLLGANSTTFVPGAQEPAPLNQVRRKLSSTDPTVGLKFQPLSDLTFRASYGTGFLPPALPQLVPGSDLDTNGSFFNITDPRRGNEPIGQFVLATGGSPVLDPEESESRSVGVILTPRFVPGLRLSIDWTEIEKRDNIRGMFADQSTINNELLIPGLITRGAPSGGFEVGPITGFDGRLRNITRQDVEAYDASLEYRLQTSAWGAFTLSAAVTRNKHNITQILPTLPQTEAVDTSGTLSWKGNASLGWEYRQWMLDWTTRYFDSYFLDLTHAVNPDLGSATIPSQTYHDFATSYRFGTSPGIELLANSEIRFGVRNVFNTRPPITPAEPYYSQVGDPRLASYYVSVSKSFF